MESRRVAPAAGTREGRRVDGEEGVRMRWEQPEGPLSSDPSLSVLCGSGGTHAHSMSFPKVRQRRSPLPHHPPPHHGLCSSHLGIQPGVVQARLDQHEEGVRGSRVGERVLGECVDKKITFDQYAKEDEDTSHLG